MAQRAGGPGGQTVEIFNPYDRSVYARVAAGRAADARSNNASSLGRLTIHRQLALQKISEHFHAFGPAPAWRRQPVH
jgi:hypothetical protein